MKIRIYFPRFPFSASVPNSGNEGDYIFQSDELYHFFVGDPEYFQGELSPKKTEKEQVEAPRYRVTSAPSFVEPDKKVVKAEVEVHCIIDE